MIIRNSFVLILISTSVVLGQMNSELTSYVPVEGSESTRKGPVQFTHVPFLLLRFNPSQLLGYNNTFQYGVEIAPPIGKLSFTFDYGSGKGKSSLNKFVRDLQPENKNKEFRGEIRAYFSDWFPFYALDKKPFGRYYSLEYVNGTYERNLGVSIPNGGLVLVPDNAVVWQNKATVEKTHVVHIKFGRHIHLHKHLFLDVYAGVGAGKSNIKGKDFEIEGEALYNPVPLGFLANKMYEDPKTKRYFFSKTFGVRIVVPI